MENNKLICTLHDNANAFYEKVFNKHKDDMLCKKGCSACCKVDLTIFQIEADRIRTWFNGLSTEEKRNLINLWSQPSKEGFCSFLKNDFCTVYEPRPLICRTQGLPLFVESEKILDYCPLNFEDSKPQQGDWLNLERLNTMLAIAAKSLAKDQRISLKDLQSELIESVE